MADMERTVLFRVAAAPEVGGGHVRRCMALAQAMGPGSAVAFSLNGERGGEWSVPLRSHGFMVCHQEYVDRAQIVVLDDYSLTCDEVTAWRDRADILVMIEDMGARFAGIDLYISPGRSGPAQATMLCGPDYALLAPDYSEPVIPVSGGRAVRHLLISFGMSDPADATGLALDAVALLPREERPELLTVVLGAHAPCLDGVTRKTSDLGGKLVTDATGLRAHYDASDLVIGAGGVSLFERMARGRPSITIVTADNQEPQAYAAAQNGGTLLAGAASDVSRETLSALLADVLHDSDRRRAIASRGRQLVDGRGASRVAEAIVAFAETRTCRQRDGVE